MATKRRTTKRTTMQRDAVILKELRAFEQRIDSRFDIQTESLKGYIDSRISQVNVKIDGMQQSMGTMQQSIGTMQQSIVRLDKKLDVRVDGLVELIERRSGEIVRIEGRLNDHHEQIGSHEKRISVLEAHA